MSRSRDEGFYLVGASLHFGSAECKLDRIVPDWEAEPPIFLLAVLCADKNGPNINVQIALINYNGRNKSKFHLLFW